MNLNNTEVQGNCLNRNTYYFSSQLFGPLEDESHSSAFNLQIGRRQLLLNSNAKCKKPSNQTFNRSSNNITELRKESSVFPPIKGLFDDYYQQLDQLRQQQEKSFLIRKCTACNNLGCQSFWVTVHGYPKWRESQVLRFFSCIGHVVEHIECDGNWMKLKYESGADALSALAYDRCNIFSDHIQVGVVCSDLVHTLDPVISSGFKRVNQNEPTSVTASGSSIRRMQVYVGEVTIWDKFKNWLCDVIFE